MNKLRAIVRREYLARVRSKWFILTTLLAPVFVVALGALPAILFLKSGAKTAEISVLDETDSVLPELARLEPFASGRYRLIAAPAADIAASRTELRQRVVDETLSGYLYVPADVLDSGRVEYWGRDVTSPQLLTELQSAVTTAVRRVQAHSLGLEPGVVSRLSRSVEMETYRVTEAGVKRERGQTWITAQVLGLAIYAVVLIYGAMMLRAAVAEKASKMVEIILSSVRPWQLMLGKVLGVGAVGLTQVGVWLAISAAGLTWVGAFQALAEFDLLSDLPLGVDTLGLFVGLFLTGYFIYAGMYAAAGAIAATEQDAAQIQLPVTLLAIVPAVLMSAVFNDPSATSSVVLSWFPPFAPVLFIGRYVLDTTYAWEIPLVFGLQALAIVVVAWLGGRIYRMGLLMTGKRPTIRELLRWMRHA